MALSLAPYLAAVIGINPMPPFLAAKDIPPVRGPLIPRDPRPGRRSGSGTGNTFGLLTDVDPNTDLTGTQWYGSMGAAGIAQQMQRDPHCRQTIRLVADPLGAATWGFKHTGDRPIDKEAAKFADWIFIEQSFWPRYRERCIANYYSCGFDMHEMTDDIGAIPAGRFPLHPGGGRGLVVTGLHEIPPNTVAYWHASKGNPNQLESVEQWQPFADNEQVGYRTIPASQIIRHTWDQEGAYFAGRAPFRSAYAPWKLKNAFQTYEAILHDRCAVPYPSATQGEHAEPNDILAVDAILEEMRSNPKGYMNLPFGYTFKWEQATCDDAANLREAIVRCNVDIYMNGSAGFLTLGINQSSGSFALSFTQRDQYHLTTRTHAEFMAAPINATPDGWSPVERIIRANYGPDVAIPRLTVRHLPTHPWAETGKNLVNAVQSGAIRKDEPTEDLIRECFEADPYDPSRAIKDEKPPAPAPFAKPNNDPMRRDAAPDDEPEQPEDTADA